MVKQELRQIFKSKRKAMSFDEVKKKSALISEFILQSRQYRESELLMAYLPILNEVDTSILISDALTSGKQVVVPKVNGDNMEFFLYRQGSMLVKSDFSVNEPIEELQPTFTKEVLSRGVRRLMLVPGIAFSKEGYRIGYGKGFYDRYLCNSKDPVTTIGLAYDSQIADEIVPEEHDIPLNYIVTESGIIEV